jgi:hypothetical protein
VHVLFRLHGAEALIEPPSGILIVKTMTSPPLAGELVYIPTLTLNELVRRLRQVGGFDELTITWFTDLLGEDRANGPCIGCDERDRHGSANFVRVAAMLRKSESHFSADLPEKCCDAVPVSF